MEDKTIQIIDGEVVEVKQISNDELLAKRDAIQSEIAGHTAIIPVLQAQLDGINAIIKSQNIS